MSASPRPYVDAACNSPWVRQYLDHLAGRDASIGPLWVQYQDQLARRSSDQQCDDGFKRANLIIQAKAFQNTHYWGDLKAAFTKIPGNANPDFALEACATIAAIRLICQGDCDPLFLLWVDRVKDQVSHTEAISFWLDRLREEHLDLAACTLQEVYQASADYCEKLWGGYMPKFRFLGRARGKNQQHKDGQGKQARDESELTRLIKAAYRKRPDADGKWIGHYLDENRAFPTRTMTEMGTRSFEESWRARRFKRVKHSLRNIYNEIKRRMREDGEL